MAAATKDAVLSSAAELARAAAEEVAEVPGLVGEHLGVRVEGERLVAHRFACLSPGYRGWHWNVTVARPPRARAATVCEVDLLPGDDAILAPAWVPWAERLQPGDLGAGDVLPYLPDDERLDQGYEVTGDADADELAIFELGLGRERVLSRDGRSEAAERWYTGTRGPTAPHAVAASAPCSTCGFLLLMAGSLRTEFGVCANEWSPDDGRVVSMDHGCGAHSQTDVAPHPSDWPDPAPLLDEMGYDPVVLDEGGSAKETTAPEPGETSDREREASDREPEAGETPDGAHETTAPEPGEQPDVEGEGAEPAPDPATPVEDPSAEPAPGEE
ncbi:DUF3027 domain-containing protein [Cellulomonas sp. APG4]|uniref:DUF3027 domain-containing protein n=1 Tax=Cellulomonas sp. APG4 TaxID=1538656 RepID=UPI00137AA3C7|nr:DUF3027 domain-containing protein [Cellulomonas sp. APG4]